MSKMQAKKDFEPDINIAEPSDLIIEKISYIDDYTEDGTYIRKPVKEKINITKRLEQSTLVLNTETVEEVIEKAKKEANL